MKKLDFKGPRDLHKTKCTNCGKETHTTFVPESGKPIYCKECFEKHKHKKE